MRIDNTYVNEFALVDEFTEFHLDLVKTINEATAEHRRKIKNIETSLLFESSIDREFMMEAEKESFLGSIGKEMAGLVERIAKFLADLVENVKKALGLAESDEDAVNKLIGQHPELRDTIVKGLNKKWFTYKDVAAYKNDIIKLTNMLQQKKIDNKTFIEKAKGALDKFNASAAPIIATGATISSLIGITPILWKKFEANRKSMNEMKERCQELQNNKSLAGELGADTLKVLTGATNNIMIEANLVQSDSKNAKTLFGKFLSAHGGAERTVANVKKEYLSKKGLKESDLTDAQKTAMDQYVKDVIAIGQSKDTSTGDKVNKLKDAQNKTGI